MITQKIRNGSFWVVDLLKGQKVRQNLNDVTRILENPEKKNSKNKKKEYLNGLLSHTKKTVPFYQKKYLSSSLSEFPVINKNIIRENYDNFISDSFKKDELFPVVTSGSTGTPFRVFQNKNKRIRNTADTLYFSSKVGYEIGQRLYYLKIWNDINKKGTLSSLVQNVKPIDVMDQSENNIESFLNHLGKDTSTKSFLGYASAYESICRYLDKIDSGKITVNVKAVISMSEALNDYTRSKMYEYFDPNIVVSRYSNVENGIIAQQLQNFGEKFLVNSASYLIEVLKIGSDQKVANGRPGRIVVTDLFNYGMPMVRYDTGDIGILEEMENGEIVLSSVEGRKMDMIYNTRGELLSSFVVTNNMWKYTDIKQYQFIQESKKRYKFKLNPNKHFDKEENLVSEFRAYLGEDAEILIKYVDEIPLLSSGKRKKTLNIWKDEA